MKNYFIAATILLLPFCTSKPKHVEVAVNKIDSVNATGPTAKYAGLYTLSGTIKNTIPVFMWFFAKDGIVKGELTYLNTKARKPILIIGQVTASEIRINEFKRDGDITGTFYGMLDKKSFHGTWWNVAADEELVFDLKAKDTLLNAIDTSLQAKEIAGTYSYAFAPNGFQGAMNVNEVSGDIYSFEISSVTPNPSRNIASVETDTVVVSNNTFDYLLKQSHNCEFKVRFYNGFAVITYIDENFDCEFGLNATVEGIYLKGGRVKEAHRE